MHRAYRAVRRLDARREGQGGERRRPGLRSGVVRAAVLPPVTAIFVPEVPVGRPKRLICRRDPGRQRVEHQLLVIAADDQVEARRGVGPLDPGQRLEGVRPAVDQVAEREEPVGCADLHLGKRMAERREMPVHVADDQVAALRGFGPSRMTGAKPVVAVVIMGVPSQCDDEVRHEIRLLHEPMPSGLARTHVRPTVALTAWWTWPWIQSAGRRCTIMASRSEM